MILWFSARTVFRVPDWLHHVLAAGRILVKNTFEAYMQQYMRSKLEQVLQEHRLVSLITQLRGNDTSADLVTTMMTTTTTTAVPSLLRRRVL